jgi:hypothetical protein
MVDYIDDSFGKRMMDSLGLSLSVGCFHVGEQGGADTPYPHAGPGDVSVCWMKHFGLLAVNRMGMLLF